MSHFWLYGCLLVGGSLWGLTIPVTKIVVSTGYQPFGLIFWQLVIGVLILGAATAARGKSLIPQRRMLGTLAVVGLIGTIIPNAFSYRAAAELPAGVMAILIAMVPMFSLPIAALIGLERLQIRRLMGVVLGAFAVILIVAPSTSLPEPGLTLFVLIALVAPFCYGIEGNFVAWRGTGSLDEIQLVYGASLIALVAAVPLMLVTDQFVNPFVPWGAPEWGIVASGVLHAGAYALYLWLVGRAGSVFASQVAYLVTLTGVLWSILLLSETYSGWIWAALVLMMIGLALVRPRKRQE